MCISYVDVDMFHKFVHHFQYQVWYGGLECKNWGEISVTDTIFVRLELAVADVYIRNGKRQYWCTDLQYLSVYTCIILLDSGPFL